MDEAATVFEGKSVIGIMPFLRSWCSGNTTDSKPVDLGSIPRGRAIERKGLHEATRFASIELDSGGILTKPPHPQT